MPVIDLSKNKWTLLGWRPFAWRLGKTMESGWGIKPDVGPYPVKLPGSVQQALRDAKLLPDWHVGLNSLACEWVEHRHWEISSTIRAGQIAKGQRVVLDARGLDYSGWLIVDGKEAGTFNGALLPHRFDLTRQLSDGKAHRVSLVFDAPPEEQGQVGYTVHSRFYKPRYNYSWDWCPRFVPIGVWDALTLRVGPAAGIDVARVATTLRNDNQTGHVEAVVEHQRGSGAKRFTLTLLDGTKKLATTATPANTHTPGSRLRLSVPYIQPWWPNGEGDPKTYTARFAALDAKGKEVWSQSRRVGFKRVRWLPCEDAPKGAIPWICEINGRPIFLQGVNWTPVRVGYHDTPGNEYEQLAKIYRDMGCNLLRVWGGAMLETEAFYDAADRHGLLVWQEFPLSSSGIDNWPPEDAASIAELKKIAVSYIRRRAHHASLLMWCGGNELQGGLDGSQAGIGKPVDGSHPCIAMLADVMKKHDPGRRFVPSSASGPRFMADAQDFGKGLHHDVHGPWGFGGMKSMDEWRDYWQRDDSLFRSEVGMPSASSATILKKYSDGHKLWPPEGEYWMHGGAWWTQADRFVERFKKLSPARAIAEYVKVTRAEQAEALGFAAAASKGRFPRCGGFIVWMGHDCFPCVSNTAVIEFDRKLKPAAHELAKVFRSPLRNRKRDSE